MKNKIRNTLVILSILFACVLGLICFAGVFSYNSVSAESIAVDEEITDLPEEKMPCNATIDDDFVDDKVLVVMADQQSSGINTIAANTSSSGGALSEFGEVTELTKESSAVLESQSDVATISALGVGNGSVENKIDAEDYKKIFSLTLKESGKQNVLDTIHELEKRDDVLYAGPDYIYTLESEPEPEPVQINETASIASVTANDPLSSNQWAIDSIGLPTMWEKTTGSSSLLVGVLDTGIDSTHPDLIDNVNRYLSRNFANGQSAIVSNPVDLTGHGTHVAGIIGAKGNNGIGITGACWNVSLVSLNIYHYDEQANGYYAYGSDTIRAIDFAASNSIPVINYSTGGNINDGALKSAIDNYSGLFVCSAGNGNRDTDITPNYPSAYNSLSNVISVGAIKRNGSRPTVSDWGYDQYRNPQGSNYGKNTVDIFAPGDDIYSTWPVSKGSYAYKGGTSMAAPFVTGVAALLLSQYPDMAAGTLKANILEGAKKSSALESLCTTGGALDATSELKFLNTSIVSEDGGWNIRVTNPTNSTLEVIYNAKMCYEGDAKEWKGLTDIAYFTLDPHSSTTVKVLGNGNATHIAFSYVDGNTRYITYSNELNKNGHINSQCAKVAAYDYDGIKLIGKNGNKWLVRITNILDTSCTVLYNSKMCYFDDAKNWTGLSDIKTFTLAKGSNATVEIQENYSATSIAIRLVNETTVITKYANNLNANTSMSCYTSKSVVNIYDNPANYLTISNSGKVSGGWSIKVTNPLNRSITVQYNSKMCFLGDAKKWTGLKDLVSITLNAKTSKTVTIKGNGTATSVVFSYINSGYRLITCADKLNANGTLNMMTSYV